MADWFEFAGTRSSDLGVIVQDFPPLTMAEERAKFQSIPGRSGSLTILEGDAVYEDVVLSIGCYVRDLDKIDLITAWLRGSGRLVLGNAPDRAYAARCVNQIEFTRLIRGRQHRTFNAVFRCSPYRYVFPEPPALPFTTSPGSITNPGTAAAEPIITVVGSGDVVLTLGARMIAIDNLAATAVIDCETGIALDGSGNDITPSVTFDAFPMTIPPGSVAVSWTGTVTSVTISRPWRYI